MERSFVLSLVGRTPFMTAAELSPPVDCAVLLGLSTFSLKVA